MLVFLRFKMLYGIWLFLVEIYLVYLYNTGRGKQLGVGKLTSISTMVNKTKATSICRYIYISFPPAKKIEGSTYLELKIQGFKSP